MHKTTLIRAKDNPHIPNTRVSCTCGWVQLIHEDHAMGLAGDHIRDVHSVGVIVRLDGSELMVNS